MPSRSAAPPELPLSSARAAPRVRGRRAPCLQAALLLAGLATLAPLCRAADATATERLMGMADCIRDAGDMKGAPREAFMKDCMARKARALAATPAANASSAPPAAEKILPGMPVKPVAPPRGEALPAQERILACASASKDMQGQARAAYLRQCLGQDGAVPALVGERGQRRADCARQTAALPIEERQSFMLTCIQAQGAPAAPAAVAQARRPAEDDGAGRRRAACVVAARDMQGEVRKSFIERCLAAPAPAAARVPATNSAAAQPNATARLLRARHCAEKVRGQGVTGVEVQNAMNACMAAP